jgi:hypothetical protein
MLELRNVSTSFGGAGGRKVLDGVSLTVARGEYVAVAVVFAQGLPARECHSSITPCAPNSSLT